MSLILRGSAGRDSIGAFSADGDTVISGRGDDFLIAGPGPDVFAFEPGDGQDWIEGFRFGVDKLQFGGGLTAASLSFQELVVEGVPGLAVIHGGEPNFVFLARATAASLSANDIFFAALNTVATQGDDVLRGTPAADTIGALGGNDVIIGLAGDDAIDGGPGLDTAVYSGVKRGSAFSGVTNGRSTVNGPEGNDTLSNVERVAFTDGRYETDPTDIAGKIYRVYDATLDREPDAAGLRGWHEAVSQGAPLLSVVASFVASPEFAAKYGSTDNPGFVRLLYRNVLGREADAEGLASWTDALNGGLGRAQVVLGFSKSQENIQRSAPAIQKGLWIGDAQAAVVARVYDTTLDRRPDEAGLKSWTDALKGGLPVNQLVDGFTGSPEFQAKYGTLGNPAFVELLYNNVLDRPSDAAGLQGWTNALNTGTPRSAVVLAFSESAEHVAKLAPSIDDGILVA